MPTSVEQRALARKFRETAHRFNRRYSTNLQIALLSDMCEWTFPNRASETLSYDEKREAFKNYIEAHYEQHIAEVFLRDDAVGDPIKGGAFQSDFNLEHGKAWLQKGQPWNFIYVNDLVQPENFFQFSRHEFRHFLQTRKKIFKKEKPFYTTKKNILRYRTLPEIDAELYSATKCPAHSVLAYTAERFANCYPYSFLKTEDRHAASYCILPLIVGGFAAHRKNADDPDIQTKIIPAFARALDRFNTHLFESFHSFCLTNHHQAANMLNRGKSASLIYHWLTKKGFSFENEVGGKITQTVMETLENPTFYENLLKSCDDEQTQKFIQLLSCLTYASAACLSTRVFPHHMLFSAWLRGDAAAQEVHEKIAEAFPATADEIRANIQLFLSRGGPAPTPARGAPASLSR